VAAALAVVAAFLWAVYYAFFISVRSSVSPVGIIAYPFLIGGLAFLLAETGAGRGRVAFGLFLSPAAWGRAGAFLGVQVCVVLVTFYSSPVDSALLSLVGDVALTPLYVMLLHGEGRRRLRSLAFLAGIVLSAAGATLTILDSGNLAPLTGIGILAAPFLPVFISVFFVESARAARQVPVGSVMAQAAVGAGLLILPATWLLGPATDGLGIAGLGAVALLVGCGLTSFWIAPALYFDSVRRAGIFLPSLLMAGIPVFTLGVTAVLLGHVPGWVGLAGIPVAVVGAVLAIRGSGPA